MQIFNKPSTKGKRNELRKNQTDAERKLWSRLRNKRFMELKFFRQAGIGNYIADFYCPIKKIVIEVDGSQHFENNHIMYDERRTEYFQSIGIHVLRFSNYSVLANIDQVMQYIYTFVVDPDDIMK